MMKVSLAGLYFSGAAAQDVFLASTSDTLNSTDGALDYELNPGLGFAAHEFVEVDEEVSKWTCVAGNEHSCRHQHGGPRMVWTCPNDHCQCCMSGEYICKRRGGSCQPGEVSTGQQCCSESTTATTTTTTQAPTEPDPSYISSSVKCDAIGSRIPRATDNGKTFRCLGGRCLPMRGRCNGVRNCADGSDEVGCTITTTSTTTIHHGSIRAVDGSRCLSVYGDAVSAAYCNAGPEQVWEWKHEGVDAVGGSFGTLQHAWSGRCLDIGVDSCEKGTNLMLNECIAHKRTQQFQFMVEWNNGYQTKRISAQACVNRPDHRDTCLDVDMASNNKNDRSKNVLLWSCKGSWSGSLNQQMGWAAEWR